MDDFVGRSNRTMEECRAKLAKREQELIGELARVRTVLSAISGIAAKPAVFPDYDVIDDILPLVRDSDRPLPQSEILERLKRTVMEKSDKDEKQATADIYRSLWYHTWRSPGKKDDPGIRAVEESADGKFKIAKFKIKGRGRRYPQNLVWHKSKLDINSID